MLQTFTGQIFRRKNSNKVSTNTDYKHSLRKIYQLKEINIYQPYAHQPLIGHQCYRINKKYRQNFACFIFFDGRKNHKKVQQIVNHFAENCIISKNATNKKNNLNIKEIFCTSGKFLLLCLFFHST